MNTHTTTRAGSAPHHAADHRRELASRCLSGPTPDGTTYASTVLIFTDTATCAAIWSLKFGEAGRRYAADDLWRGRRLARTIATGFPSHDDLERTLLRSMSRAYWATLYYAATIAR